MVRSATGSDFETKMPFHRTFEELFLQFGLGNLNLNGLVDLLSVTAPMIGIVLDRC